MGWRVPAKLVGLTAEGVRESGESVPPAEAGVTEGVEGAGREVGRG